MDTIAAMLPGCSHVCMANAAMDRCGVDYIARLRGGAEVYVDAKTRGEGCSRYWQQGEPEMAIELWSVRPGGTYGTPRTQAKAGWTLDEAKQTDLVLYTWHPHDSERAFLLGFQTLRVAARAHLPQWLAEYKRDVQDSGAWESEAVFVPWRVVMGAMAVAQMAKVA